MLQVAVAEVEVGCLLVFECSAHMQTGVVCVMMVAIVGRWCGRSAGAGTK